MAGATFCTLTSPTKHHQRRYKRGHTFIRVRVYRKVNLRWEWARSGQMTKDAANTEIRRLRGAGWRMTDLAS